MKKNVCRARSSPARVTAIATSPRLEEGQAPSPPPASRRSKERHIRFRAMNVIYLNVSFLSSMSNSLHILATSSGVP
ncbi:hypothetical protein E2C01_100829 [Portunus trituberculatus]|uniref:Uncharacterized protein n=1 Tax=Portunus trituberculatus TaxID=210409 RepID=A0A5B7K448_PORTR|nr:hypothetical protein [Portunus trituberculatus]